MKLMQLQQQQLLLLLLQVWDFHGSPLVERPTNAVQLTFTESTKMWSFQGQQWTFAVLLVTGGHNWKAFKQRSRRRM
jgi:hypothetical protein